MKKTILFMMAVITLFTIKAQNSPSQQVKVTTPSTLSGCDRDTIFLEFTNKGGPTCTETVGMPPEVEFVINAPGTGQILFQDTSVGSMPMGASQVSIAGQTLTMKVPVPSFGTTIKAWFVVNATCDVTGLNPLPAFDITANYPTGFPINTETWTSAKMNTGVGEISATNHKYYNLNDAVGFNEIAGDLIRIKNTGFGNISELVIHEVLDDSIYNRTYGGIGGLTKVRHLVYRYSWNGTAFDPAVTGYVYQHLSDPDWDVDVSTLNGKRYLKWTLRGKFLPSDGVFKPKDRIVWYAFERAPQNCLPAQRATRWITYNCIAGGESCAKPDTLTNDILISAGIPIISASNDSVEVWDGCPDKKAYFSFKNTGEPSVGRPEVSTAYDVELSVPIGGNLVISNLVFAGTNPIAAEQTFPGAATTISWKIKDFNTTPIPGLVDADGDGFIDDMRPGDSVNVSFEYTVDCDLACGKQLDYNIKANSTFTDFCGKLNGSRSDLLYRFGFKQTKAVSQKTPLPNLGTIATSSKNAVEGVFGFNYKHYGMDTSQAVVTLRINYGKNQQVLEPVQFLGLSLNKSDFTIEGNESVPAGATDTAAGDYNNLVDTDSVWVYTLSKSEIALLLDNVEDNLKYSMAHIACDSFQQQTNQAGWSIMYQINTNSCPPVPCALDLSCGKAFAYNYSEGCGSFPCYNETDSIFRTSPFGHTNEDQTTSVTPTPAGTSKFYEGDTITHRSTAILSSDLPRMEALGHTPVDPRTRGFFHYFTWTYDKPADVEIEDLHEAYFNFVEEGSTVKVYDTSGGTMTLLHDLPLKKEYFNTTSGVANNADVKKRNYELYDNLVNNYTAPSTNGIPGSGLGDLYCFKNSFTIDQGSCPYFDHRYKDVNSNMYLTMQNVAKTRVSEQYYLYWEQAFIDAAISFDPGYTKYKWVVDTKWRINPDYPHTNVSDFVYKGRLQRSGNKISRPYEARTLLYGCANVLGVGTAVTTELTVDGSGADYNSTCGLTVHNKLKFNSVVGDYFPGEVRVPYKLDSFTVDLPAEYHTTTTTPTTLTGSNGGGAADIEVTGTASATGYTGHLVFTKKAGTSTASYMDFPRISDADGGLVAWDVAYPITNATTDNSNIDGYKVPVNYYVKDEFGNAIIIKDTFTISEANPKITVEPLGGPVQIDDGGACSNSYMDVLVSNNTIYGADYLYIAAEGTMTTNVVDIKDAPNETPNDAIEDADTNQYGGNNVYAELGGMIAGGRRVVRVYFNSTACEDSIKIYSNFGCNYPAGREPVNTGNTLDSAYIKFNATEPGMMSGPTEGNKNIADLCDMVELEIEVRNVKNANLTNILAGVKLPANAVYVAGSAEIAYPTNLWVAAPTVTVTGTDSITVNVSDDVDLTHPCGLPGVDEKKFPTVNFQKNNSYPANTFKLKFKIDFTACPMGTASEVVYNITGQNYCGKEAKTTGVFNLIYTGVVAAPNTYTCKPANSSPIEICADSGDVVTIIDSVYITNSAGAMTIAGDSVAITVATDTNRFILSNFTADPAWGAPVVSTNPEGRTILTFGIPAGIAVGAEKLMIMQYDLEPKLDNMCQSSSQACPEIAHSMSFFSTIELGCAAKGLTCTGLGTVTRGSGYVPRELTCCKQGLGNYVWLDNNEDGIQDTDEPGVAGVVVDLYDNGPDGVPGGGDDVLVGSTTTDSYGKYYFDDIPTGDYNVKFTPPANYTFTDNATAGDNQDNTNSDVEDDNTSPNFGKTGSINIELGEQDSTIDAGLILPKPTTATVGDYVWMDTDGDGVQDPNEAGVSGVLVNLVDAAGNVVASTYTDSDGKYLFKDVAPGDYSVKFNAPPGTVFTTTGSDGTAGGTGDADDDSDADATGKTPTFTVAAGDNYRNVDAGLVPQTELKASLGDRVWYDDNKDGVQDPGEVGIEGVKVELKDTLGNVLATTYTDVNGNYTFNNLDAGYYKVKFTKPAGFTASPFDDSISVFGDGQDGLDSDADDVTGETGIIELWDGERNPSIDAGFYKPGTLNSIGNKVWYDDNKDGVQDAGEVGVKGVTVRLLDGSGNPVNNPATGKPYVLVTDENGEYKFVGLPDGDYQIQFDNLPEGNTFTQSNNPGDNSDDTNSDADLTGRTKTYNLSGGEDETTADAGIFAGDAGLTASLGNKVWYDLNNDGIQDEGETGVEGITVTLKDYGPDGLPGGGDDGPDRTTTTNAQGEYLFTGLDASNYVVEFSDLPAGYTPSPKGTSGDDATDSDGNPVSGGVSKTDVIKLSAGEENLDVDLGINKPNVNTIGNKVWLDANKDGIQDPDEIGVPGVQVTLLDAIGQPIDGDPATPGVQPIVTTTDKNGNYLFTDLPDGTYSVKFDQLPDGFTLTGNDMGGDDTKDSDADSATGISSTVTVTGGQTNLDLDAGIKSDTKAVLGDKVWFDEDGDGIQDPNEKGIPGVLVTLYDGAGNPIATTVTDSDGNYLFPNLDPGTYSVGFTNLPEGTEFTGQNAGGNDSLDSDVDPATGRTAPITLNAGDVNLTVDAGVKPPPTATVGNYVWFDQNDDGIQDANEPPVPGVIVTLKDGNGDVIGTTVTDGDGKYLFTNVPAGTGYTVEFDANIPNWGALDPLQKTPLYTSQDPTNIGDNGSVVPPGGAFKGNIGVSPPFDVAHGSHTRLLDAGINNAMPLPIENINLDVYVYNNYNKLVWEGIDDDNVLVYELLKGKSASTLNAIFTKNVTEFGVSHTYNDNNITNGIVYYQVRATDENGNFTYSDIRMVSRNVNSTITIYPNPANAEITIDLGDATEATRVVSLMDGKGTMVLESSIEANHATKTLNIADLAPGVYALKVDNEVFMFVKE